MLRRILIAALIVVLTPASIEFTLRATQPHRDWHLLVRQSDSRVIDDIAKVGWDDDGALDYASRYLNVRDHQRVTVGQPAKAKHHLYMFGSSTLFGWYNTDAGTLASQLQQLTPDFVVHNRGAAGDSAILMTARLKKTPVAAGDVVVFFGGEIELMHLARALDGQQFDLCRYALQNASDVMLNHLICEGNTRPASLDNRAYPAAVDQYCRSVNAARQYVAAAGGEFYNVLEPMKFSRSQSPRERELSSFDLPMITAESIYPTVYAAFARCGAVDASHALDTLRQNGIEVYVDNYHVTDAANAYIARAIHAAIWKTF